MEGQVHQDQVHHSAPYTFSFIRFLLQPPAVYPRAIQKIPREQAEIEVRLPRMSGTHLSQTEITEKRMTISVILFLFHSFNLQVLYLVGGVLVSDENSHHKVLASCSEGSQGILHIGSSRLMGDLERARRIGLEERLEHLAGLAAAVVVGGREDGDLQIVREPGGQLVHISLSEIFRYRSKDLITS